MFVLTFGVFVLCYGASPRAQAEHLAYDLGYAAKDTHSGDGDGDGEQDARRRLQAMDGVYTDGDSSGLSISHQGNAPPPVQMGIVLPPVAGDQSEGKRSRAKKGKKGAALLGPTVDSTSI